MTWGLFGNTAQSGITNKNNDTKINKMVNLKCECKWQVVDERTVYETESVQMWSTITQNPLRSSSFNPLVRTAHLSVARRVKIIVNVSQSLLSQQHKKTISWNHSNFRDSSILHKPI